MKAATSTMMQAFCIVLVLGVVYATVTRDGYYFGQECPKDAFTLFKHVHTVMFDVDHKKFVAQFNTCKDYNVSIEKVELKHYRGKPITVEQIKGGEGTHFVGLELSAIGLSEGNCEFEIEVLGQWIGNRTGVEHEKAFKIGDAWQDCQPTPVTTL